jgi:hypothetical protein
MGAEIKPDAVVHTISAIQQLQLHAVVFQIMLAPNQHVIMSVIKEDSVPTY